MHFSVLKKRQTTHRLARLMELYETNYLLMRLLIPDLRQLDSLHYVSRQSGCIDLSLTILERCKYTTTLKLGYDFADKPGRNGEPDLVIRIYHDARTAEVMSGLIHGRRHEQRRVRDLDDGWVLNKFLNKWMRYCLYRGHAFRKNAQH